MSASVPRAVGQRLPYERVPLPVRRWVESALASPVVDARTQTGGMSPGCAARLRLADGRRAFVKAVGDELNPQTPSLFRHELEVLRHLRPAPYRPGVLGHYDDGRWVGLLLQDVHGRHPDLSSTADADAVWRTVAAQAEELTPPPAGLWITRLTDSAERWCQSWGSLAKAGEDVVPSWLARRLPELSARVAGLVDRLPVEALCHWDVRDDNLLVHADGNVAIVDWGMARLGPCWADLFMLCLEWADGAQFDHRMARIDADADTVTDLLLALGGHLAYRATRPAPRVCPRLRRSSVEKPPASLRRPPPAHRHTVSLTIWSNTPACRDPNIRLIV
jgi:aminoglycoside phosphotransferase